MIIGRMNFVTGKVTPVKDCGSILAALRAERIALEATRTIDPPVKPKRVRKSRAKVKV